MRDDTRKTAVWEALRQALAVRSAATGRAALHIVDAGGGTGGFAVPLARLGHTVTVVDPALDSLAALERRAAETGVQVRGLQGDAADLGELVEPSSADLVLCHSVLEYVEDPAGALSAVGGVLCAGGVVSVLAANSVAAALHRGLAGHFGEAARVLSDPAGRWGDRDPTPRRFSRTALEELLVAAGFTIDQVHGVRIFADLVPSTLAEADVAGLVAVERLAAVHPVLRDIATQLHLIAHR